MRRLDTSRDAFGLGWRPELAGAILRHLDRIDVVELMAEDFLAWNRDKRHAIKTLQSAVPIVLHCLSLGLASSAPVEHVRLEALARLVNEIEPDFWSEHLAFVRAGGIELGHLAATPRNDRTIESTVRNIARATEVVGTRPLLENIATLLEPPGSTLSEVEWVREIVERADATLLLDLHNVYANGSNFGFRPDTYVAALPADRVQGIHLAGGQWVDEPSRRADGSLPRRVLDDHKHPVPDEVYELLTLVAERTPTPVTVILEYDGDYPPFASLLDQLDRARTAVARGRERSTRRSAGLQPCHGHTEVA